MSENVSLIEWLTKLSLSKQLTNIDILNGTTVNSILSKIIPNYTVRLPNTNTASTRINNWNIVIKQLEQVGIKVGQQERTKILNGDEKVVYNILYELKAIHDKSRQEVQVDINKLDARGDPKTAKSLLEMLILVITKHYNFSIKEAVALLSNDSKYLAHILAKGYKDNPEPVENMLLQLVQLLPQIMTFCKNKQNQTFFLKSIKPGLISKFLSISQISLTLLTAFVKTIPEKLQVVKVQLMATFILSQRRHPIQVRPIIHSLLDILGYNKNLLAFIQSHSHQNEITMMTLELLNIAEEQRQVQEVFSMFKFVQIVEKQIDLLRNAQEFASSASLLLKITDLEYSELNYNSEYLVNIIDNLGLLNLSRRGDVIMFTNVTFGFLHIFGKRKNPIAPQFLKLLVQKYKSNLNEDESQNYLSNFLNIMDIFPSIPSSAIAEAVLFRYQTSTCFIGELQLQVLENAMEQMDQKGALRAYNIITKLFVEQAGYCQAIISILEHIIKKFNSSKIIFDLNVKFVKICLAIFYANIRKLNYSKSLVQGYIKLDLTNAFYKVKNSQIIRLLSSIIKINDDALIRAIEPLICYTVFQSELKNKEETQGLKKAMNLLGEQQQLRRLYQADAKALLEEARNEGRKDKPKEEGNKMRVNSDASLLHKKKNYLSTNTPQVSVDAQKGLQRYTKAFKEKMVKLSLQEQKKLQQVEKKEELRKKFTLKILEKGVKLAKDQPYNCIYEYGSKEKQIQRDFANDFYSLPFYDPEVQQDRDVKAVQYFTKKYSKLFRVYYNSYGGKLRPNTIKLFEDISQTAHLMQTANVWKMLRDHNMDLFITIRQVQHTVQKINAHLKKQYKDSSLLDFEVFENFIIQAAFIMFSRPPKDMRTHPVSDMLQEIISKLRQHAHENKIDEKLFEDNQAYQSNKAEEVKQLNEKLAENPDYIVPEGYKKITVKRMVFDYEFKFESQSELRDSCKDVMQILDQMLYQPFGFHILQPYSSTMTQATARPILYNTSLDHSVKERSLSSALPKISRLKDTVKEEGEEGGPPQEGGQTEFRESKTPSQLLKVQNKFLKEKKQREEEKQKRLEEEQKRREARDRELKAMLEKNREKQQESQKERQERRRIEKEKEEEEKKRKAKYQQELKKKVEEYMKKKEAQKAKQDEQRRKKKQEEQRNLQKMKQDIERKKKMVEESKLKKKQQEQQRLQKQKAEKQRLQEQNKVKNEQKKEKNRQLLQQYKQRKQKQEQEKQRQRQQSQVAQTQLKPKTSKLKSSVVKSTQSKAAVKPKEPTSKDVKVQQLDDN